MRNCALCEIKWRHEPLFPFTLVRPAKISEQFLENVQLDAMMAGFQMHLTQDLLEQTNHSLILLCLLNLLYAFLQLHGC